MPDTLLLLAAVGYGLAALAYLGLSGLIVASWRRRPQGRQLVLATGLSAAWGAFSALTALGALPPQLGLAAEVARNGAWLALLLYILQLRLPSDAILPAPIRLIRILSGILVGVLLLASVYPFVAPAQPVLARWAGNLGLVLLTVMGLVLTEQVYRSTRPEDRWAIKFLCLGLGGLFVYDFYLYANAALFNAMDAQVWAARGYVAALVTPLIAVSAARNPEWAAPVGLSRSMAFHTASLLAAGIYLLLMASAGYYLRLFGGEWGNVVQTVFIFAAAMLLVLLMFSGTLRARLRVFLSKHFFSYRYDYREEWLNFTRTLTEGRPGEQLCERAVEALAGLLESPGGALWMREGDAGYQRASHWNWADLQGTEPADAPFIQWLASKQWVVDLDEMKVRRDLYGDLSTPAWLEHADNAWLVVPLMLHEELLGFVVLKHSLGNVTFNWEVSDLLKVAARQAAAHLAQMRASNQLIVARQFESFNRTTTFVIHDLKNLIAQLSLLLANAEKHKHKPEFQADMLDTVANAVTRMNKVLAQLRRGSDAAQVQSVVLADILDEAVASKQAFKLRPTLELPPASLRVRAERDRLTRAIGHLLQNALEATPPTGQVTLRGFEEAGRAIIEIVDTGCGMDDEFIRTRLFQPFDSTKGAGMGIGAYECRETLRALGGNIEVDSTPGLGTHFRLSLPLDNHSPA
ncbi:XrtA/PEP-CTERM system histidine kinase PrsK [Thiobacillus sp.]|uniref:XrtA/PEP-CTERM system histidine kinase PrsK n=1 Tax=Thiobacillus sp. TaxID=924 RepID=UPI0017ACDE2B|nr:XrtA/PEP-CTERM system histidine kinase PrsK [Thiobacillus sp.]MBC2729608.1 PEP-CTERM system histidine kinase PrsK [Thiobacillus sp.]MBC2738343.1 PEP-CTERM system histidine kinase PrsK [Thiobacillus sp.]MBC2761378.1 PEP-CTERM system histidine kinase PrsK [Thiobacillus sp.]